MTLSKLMTTWMMPELPTLLIGELEEITRRPNDLKGIATVGTRSRAKPH